MSSPHTSPDSSFTGARAMPELVGRKKQIQEIVRFVEQTSHGCLIHIEGDGGIGKTRLEDHARVALAGLTGYRVASELIDLYHVETTTVEGLASEICRVLQQGEHEFAAYQSARSELEAARLHGGPAGIQQTELRRQMLASFRDDLQQLGATLRLVVALDTAEKLELQYDPQAEQLGQVTVQDDTVEWLCDLVRSTDGLVVLLAGRPASGRLEAQLEKLLSERHYHVALQGLTEEEALDYFDAIISRLEESGERADRQSVRLIKILTEDERRSIFYCLCESGPPPTVRPILLALAIDYQTLPQSLPIPEFNLPSAVTLRFNANQRAAIQDRLGAAIIDALSNRLQPADLLVRAMGWLRKGVTQELLRQLAGVPPAEFDRAWADIRNLSFIKIRARDQVLFLHDEMYAIVDRHALKQVTAAEPDRIIGQLRPYYEKKIDEVRSIIDRLFRPLAPTSQDVVVDINEINQLRRDLRSLIVSYVYYRLRHNASNGFQVYSRYADAAAASNDEELVRLLQAEMRAFIEEVETGEVRMGGKGLNLNEVSAYNALLRLKSKYQAGQGDEARVLAAALQGPLFADVIQMGGSLAEAELETWSGLLEIEVGNHRTAEQSLTQALARLETLPESHRRVSVQAWAYNHLGYLYSIQGRYYKAVQSFERALPLWRALRSEIEQATTLNNLAFALAELGEFDDAHRFIRDAIHLRERLGPQVPVAYSLNTLAEINIRDFASEIAVEQAERARDHFAAHNHWRGRALALRALAEATRRISVSPTNQQLGKTIALLELAEGYALEAADIFDKVAREPVRYVWALIELGSIYRDWLRWRLQVEPKQYSPKEQNGTRAVLAVADLYRMSDDAFTRAAQQAEQIDATNHYLDAMINRAWLIYIRYFDPQLGEFSPAAQAELETVRQALERHFVAQYGARDTGIAHRLTAAPRDDYLIRLGDWEAFLGEVELQSYRVNQSNAARDRAFEHYLIAFVCYDRYSSKEVRQSRRTYARLYEILKSFGTRAILQFYESLTASESTFGMPNSALTTFMHKQFGPKENHVVLEDD